MEGPCFINGVIIYGVPIAQVHTDFTLINYFELKIYTSSEMIISCPGIFISLNLHNFLLELHVSKGKLELLYLNNVLTKCNKQIKIVQNINIYWCLQLYTKKDQKFKLN